MNFFISLILLFFFQQAAAQAIDNTESYRQMNSQKYIRVFYENDFFTASDEYYTQGIQIEFAHPRIKNYFLSKMLWLPGVKSSIHGIALQTEGYTPVYIDRSEIQSGDRPFASSILFKTFSYGSDSAKQIRVATTLSIGVVGPAAGGKEIQTTIHKWINYTLPLGWHNQISNDIILNYQVNFNKGLIQNKYLLIMADGSARAGTYSTRLRTGFTVMIGNFDSPFLNIASGKKWKYYIYNQPQVNFIGFDASLQGGFFNRSSVYTIPNKDLARITFQNRYGAVVTKGKLYVEYFQYYLTKEFETGREHRSGGIQFGWRIE